MTPSELGDDVGERVAVDDVPRRLHPLSPFFDLILLGRQFALPVLVGLFANRDRGQLVFVVPAVVGAAVGFVRWLRFTYVFDGRRFVISSGVLTRQERVLPLDRIQQVDMQTRLRHRIFGVTVLKIDTAGGTGGAEVDLSVVSSAEAARLRHLLLAGRPAATVTEGLPSRPGADETGEADPKPAGPPDVVLARLSVRRLMLAGVTGSELAVMLTIVGWVFQLLDDLPTDVFDVRPGAVDAPAGPADYVVLAAVGLAVWFGLAAAASVLRHGGYVLSRRGDDLHASRGVFDKREASVPGHRVQSVRVQETFVRRWLRMTSVRLRSTAGAIDVPLLTRPETEHVLEAVLPGRRPDHLVAAPGAARRRAIARRVVPVLVPAIGASVWLPRLVPFAVLVVVLGGLCGELAYRGLAHGWAGGFVVAREGGIRRETVIVPSAKAQSTRLRTTPFQRRAGLATLWIDVAGGGTMPAIRDGDADRLRTLQSELLAAAAARQDEAAVRRQRTPQP